jgi:TRAP-type C4-dicarboxylate transport system permease small subunit
MTSSKRRSEPRPSASPADDGRAISARTTRRLGVVETAVGRVENALAIGLLIAIVLDVSLQVLFRYVLSHSLSWSSELATYMFAWLTLLGMAIAQRERAHIEVQFFGHLSPGVRVALSWVAWLASLAFFAVLLFGGYFFFEGDTIQSGPATGIPLWAVYSSLPVGAALGIFHVLCDLRYVNDPDRGLAPHAHGSIE